MNDYRKLSTEEIKALTTVNCCANALSDHIKPFEKWMSRNPGFDLAGKLSKAAELAAEVVRQLVETAPDEDQRTMILRRMSGLQLRFGYVAKHPEEMVHMDVKDANLILAPLLDRCELECPCVDDAYDRATQHRLVKSCETRKALARLGVAETGLGSMCKYQFLVGGKGDE